MIQVKCNAAISSNTNLPVSSKFYFTIKHNLLNYIKVLSYIYLNKLSNVYLFFIGKNIVFLKILSKFYISVVFAVMM